MTAHLIAEPTTAVTTHDPATTAPGWLTLSAALTEEVPVITDREDLLVTVAPGAGHGAPACFLPTHATIELDGTHLGSVDPATATPRHVSDRARYSTAWGLLTHECAHAAHTTWQPPPDAPPGALAAALLLEESRIEAAQIRRRPDDRHWLRASATNLILADTHADDPAHAPTMTPRDAAHTAALLVARTDGGILTRAETAPVTRAVATVLGADTLAKLRAVWKAAHTIADDDAQAMIDLGRRWCEVLGADPDSPDKPDTSPAGQPSYGSGTATPPLSPLAEAITATLRKVARAVAHEPVPSDPATRAKATKATQDAAEQTATKAAHAVFVVGGPRTGDTTMAGTRPPTTAERTAARVLARALSTAGVRDRVVTKTTSVTPPGRLRMRGALVADAQRAVGALPTAEPFTRTTRTTVPTPPLRLGIACDVSGSMRHLAPAVASTAWILAHAAHHATVPADTATVIFGHHVRPITRSGGAPTEVTEFTAKDNWEDIPTAIDALDGALGLSRPGAARLLVIISDGHFREGPRLQGQQRLDRLRATGCGLLWLSTDATDTPLDGVTVHLLTDPVATAQTIGHAATAALRVTH